MCSGLPMGVYSNQKKPERHGFKPHIGEHNPATVLDVDVDCPGSREITETDRHRFERRGREAEP